MKIVLIVVGALGGIYAIAGIVQLVSVMNTTNPESAYGTSRLAASVVPVAIGLVVCLVCFGTVFSKPKAGGPPAPDAKK
jgi:uncharacterized membrane protein